MIESSALGRDRLSSFFAAFDVVAEQAQLDTANLVMLGQAGEPQALIFLPHVDGPMRFDGDVLAAVRIDFGGPANPLIAALPGRVDLALESAPAMQAVARILVTEASARRCGRQVALDNLCKLLLLLLLRHLIDQGTTRPGLLAGLSHPQLFPALTAMQETPARDWRIDHLAVIAGMSRTRFMTLFPQVVGVTPMAYLAGWRMVLARRELERGGRVKLVARRIGYGSAAAFSRAYQRAFGEPPVARRKSRQGEGALAVTSR
ncbi:AraC family transcriptional regulator [Bosea sp. LjRoot90]|uniref:helix-turn-helix transcriptional regulator n=1 Tax=Bosea sp. LjRoot90 TaxID=3342342 RepID=UPI003ECC387B